jgi:hypothetical protein
MLHIGYFGAGLSPSSGKSARDQTVVYLRVVTLLVIRCFMYAARGAFNPRTTSPFSHFILSGYLCQSNSYLIRKMATEAPWHAGYPAPKSETKTISREEVLELYSAGKQPGVDFLLIDLRRNDHEVSHSPPLWHYRSMTCSSKLREAQSAARSTYQHRQCITACLHCTTW